MASLNRVMLIGNLTRDPELRYIPSGTAVTTFSIAVNRVYKTPSGEKKEDVSFIRIVVWGKMGETCAEYLKKGSSCFVEGRLQSRSWDAPDGQKRSITEVNALNVQFLGGRPGAGRSSEEYGEHQHASSSQGPLEEISLDMPSEPPAGMGGDVAPF
ncbi:MAG: single-stranded DNA-binding protein [Candidatus Omnitrophica bacterium]|jgi:single-strand DNA-binding protein|nr:single-stranded DNA-binding protein [Candidatus Omnitrophota bacterium]